MGAATHDSMPCCAGQFDKSFAFSIRSLSPLSYMGLNLACIVQRFLHGNAIPSRGASPSGARESSHRRLSPHSPLVLKWANCQKSVNTHMM